MQRASLRFETKKLMEAGLLSPNLFRHNRSVEVLHTFNFDAQHTTQILRLERREGSADLSAERRAILARYALDYFEVLHRDPDQLGITILVRQRNSKGLQGILTEAGGEVFPGTPCRLAEEECTITLYGPGPALERILRLLRRLGLRFRVTGLRPFLPGPPGGDLTAHQRGLVVLAAELGYFDIPRRCGLRHLGAIVGVSPVAVGKALRRAERTMVHALLMDGER